MKKTSITKKSGFVVLYAVLVSSLLISIGLSIFSLSSKEFALSAAASESQISVFAADAGLECALYWDLKGTDVFATSTDTRPVSNTFCMGQDITESWRVSYDDSSSPKQATTTFILYYNQSLSSESPCAQVQIGKAFPKTHIEARGYNICNSQNIRQVERGLRVTY